MGRVKVTEDGLWIKLNTEDFIRMADKGLFLGNWIYWGIVNYLKSALPETLHGKLVGKPFTLLNLELYFRDLEPIKEQEQ